MIRVSTLLIGALLLPVHAWAQTLSQRGFVEVSGIFYPQAAPNDDTRAVGEALIREEASWRPRPWLTFAGAFDARLDSHDRVEREWVIDWSDRGVRRPALNLRRASAIVRRGGLSVEAGKQFIRWGKADVLNPTDRFAPRDFLEVVANEFLGVAGLRATWERQQDTLEAVWTPRFTPSRIPLLSQRWAVLPAIPAISSVPSTSATPSSAIPLLSTPAAATSPSATLLSATPAATTALSAYVESGFSRIPLVDLGARYPARSQLGLRWNHVASRVEFSISAYDGFNHLPTFDAQLMALPDTGGGSPFAIQFHRVYPRMRMFGGDAAVPTRWLTLKGEAAYFDSPDNTTDEYATYVVQVERQAGEWFLVGGYAGEVVRTRRITAAFTPDRGLANTFLGRASYTIDASRGVSFEGAVRRNGNGGWVKSEYSQAVGQHWRATLGINLIAGKLFDFLGQYRRNSNLALSLRCSF